MYDTESHKVFFIFRSSGLMYNTMAIQRRKLSASNGSSRRHLICNFSIISMQGMEGICHRRLVSESGAIDLRRLEVARNRKVPVDQAQVQRTFNECRNHFNKVPENQIDMHPENWDYQPPLYTAFHIKN